MTDLELQQLMTAAIQAAAVRDVAERRYDAAAMEAQEAVRALTAARQTLHAADTALLKAVHGEQG